MTDTDQPTPKKEEAGSPAVTGSPLDIQYLSEYFSLTNRHARPVNLAIIISADNRDSAIRALESVIIRLRYPWSINCIGGSSGQKAAHTYMASEKTEDKKQLADLIDKAESEGKWLHCSYQDLWFSPAQLRAENAKGSFVWGVVNWNLRDPKEKLARLEQEEKNAATARERFERELQNAELRDAAK